MPDASSNQLQPGQVLENDVKCTRCGYNLRGLSVDKLCPECGTPIERSTHGNFLRFADPAWLDKLRLGTVVMVWNLLIILVLGVGAVLLTLAGLPETVVILLGLLANSLGLWAMFLVTTPEPAIAFEEDPITLRKLVRTSAVLDFVGNVFGQTARGAGLSTAVLVGAGFLQLTGLVAQVGFFIYFRRFALRIPGRKLAGETTTVMWGFAITMGLATVFGVIAAFATGGVAVLTGGAAGGPTTLGPVAGVAVVFACIGGVGLLIFGIWYVVLLFRYRNALTTAVQEARVTLAGGESLGSALGTSGSRS